MLALPQPPVAPGLLRALAYQLSTTQGYEMDQPRSPAKSVAVE